MVRTTRKRFPVASTALRRATVKKYLNKVSELGLLLTNQRYNMMKELTVLANLLCISVVVIKSVDASSGKQRHIFKYNETEAKHLLYLAAAAYTTNPEPCIKK
ncbi:unnamed protein product [Gongylonema pulchrum]|uniref:Cystatin domain-containing protein n=1 Tax=Gongylonema pulchrum TaxID=637853 RepID=A0A183E5V4_9BILA|nr:unnamed protein product [Gongylonema pulchrum]